MNKIFLSFMMITGLVAIAGAATYAVFSAQGSIVGNTISSASVDLRVHNLDGKPLSASALVPGQWTGDGKAELYNTGTAASNVYMYVENAQGPACNKINLRVSTGFAGGDETSHVLYSGPLASIVGPGQRFETTIAPPFDTLNPNITQVIHQAAQLDASADNSYQNASCTWDEIFVAENVAPAAPAQ